MSEPKRSEDDEKKVGDPITPASSDSESKLEGAAAPASVSDSSIEFTIESITQYLQNRFGFTRNSNDTSAGESKKVIEDLSFDGLMKHWKETGFKNIITMVGAGISTSAGIPDFRSPGDGLYHNLEQYNLPHPTAIFEMDFFLDNPKPFYVLAKELYPGSFKPTPCHYFVKLLEKKGLLLRHYTQNIDTLERIADIRDDKLVEAHGTFYTNHCLGCKKLFSMEWMKNEIFSDRIPTCDKCKSIVKPDIVFFGENLPQKFYELPSEDFKKCDLLIIMGTSLEVQPFASLIEKPKSTCIRLLINREKVGNRFSDILGHALSFFGKGLCYDQKDNTRDIAWIGDCDDGVYAITDALGWTDELNEMIRIGHEEIDKKEKEASNTNA